MKTQHATGAGLTVSADLNLQVMAPDGSAATIRVTDRAGELVVDVDRPLVVVKSLPTTADLRVLSRGLGSLGSPAAVGGLPPLRVRSRGVTLAVARSGGARPGIAVLAVALLTVSATVLAVVVAVRRIVAGLRN